MRAFNKDYWGGSLIFVLGLGTIYQGEAYRIGTLANMGPGFFPITLGVLLSLTGLAIVVRERVAGGGVAPAEGPPQWRGWISIALGLLAFIVLGRYGGLVPATFGVVFISALGDRQNSARGAALLALAIVVACVVIFWWALRVQFPLFSWG